MFLEAIVDLDRFNLLQPNPNQAMGPGSQARSRQWDRIAGGQAAKMSFGFIAIGLSVGAVVGAAIGLQVPPVAETIPQAPLALALVLAPLGGYAGHVLGGLNAYQQGQMLVVANERRSPIRPEMVTGQVEAWVPKALLAWRSHEWRYSDGKPYLWVQLQARQRIQEVLTGTLDYLLLQNDLHRAKDAAIYAQRSWNRMISDNALDFADVNKGDDEGESKLVELAPYLVAGVVAAGGLLLAIMTSG